MNISDQKQALTKVLFIDNFDSFSFNIVDDIKQLGFDITVVRNDVKMDTLKQFITSENITHIVISPGPGSPKDAGNCVELINAFYGIIPIFGICLGFQAIVEARGGTVGKIKHPFHGKASNIFFNDSQLLSGLPNPFRAGRYHSLGAEDVPQQLKITASVDEVPMAIENCAQKIYAVQFHPESILTPDGNKILSNFFAQTV
jgi:anthranilate synthase component 2